MKLYENGQRGVRLLSTLEDLKNHLFLHILTSGLLKDQALTFEEWHLEEAFQI